MKDMNEVYQWAEKVRDKNEGVETPIEDEEVLAGLILALKAGFPEFKEDAMREHGNSRLFWEEFRAFEEEYENHS